MREGSLLLEESASEVSNDQAKRIREESPHMRVVEHSRQFTLLTYFLFQPRNKLRQSLK